MSALTDAVSRGIVAAAKACGEDPFDVANGAAKSRARIYVFQALRRVFPTLQWMTAARMCGAPKPPSLNASASAAWRTEWWREATMLLVAEAMKSPAKPAGRAAQTIAAAQKSVTATVSMKKASDPDVPPWRPPVSASSVTAALMGDPLPGRSALDQRRAAQ